MTAEPDATGRTRAVWRGAFEIFKPRIGCLTNETRSRPICTNLMEGSYRLNRGEYRQFVGIARGSCGEQKSHLLLAKDLGYISENDYLSYREESDEISKMLQGLAKSLSSPKAM